MFDIIYEWLSMIYGDRIKLSNNCGYNFIIKNNNNPFQVFIVLSEIDATAFNCMLEDTIYFSSPSFLFDLNNLIDDLLCQTV